MKDPAVPQGQPQPCPIDGLTGLDLGMFCPNCRHVALAHDEDGQCAPCTLIVVANQFTEIIKAATKPNTTTTRKAGTTWQPSRSKR